MSNIDGKKIVAAALLIISLTACSPQLLYNWGPIQGNGVSKYENLTYRHYDKHTPSTICELIVLYETIIANPGGKRQVPPPGVCAEYGYLLMHPEIVDTFLKHATPAQMRVFRGKELSSYFFERGKEMFELEQKHYPESAVFIGPILKKISTNNN